MQDIYRRYMLRSLLGGSAVAAIVGLLGMAYLQATPAQVFAQARNQWMHQPVPRYRLVIERPTLQCQQNLVVENEQIVPATEHNDCPIRSLTMTELFDRIAWLDGMTNFEMMPPDAHGCACESVLQATVEYDHELGYPRQVAIADRRTLDWQEPDCWRYVLLHGTLPACDVPLIFGSQPRITNISLTPLP